MACSVSGTEGCQRDEGSPRSQQHRDGTGCRCRGRVGVYGVPGGRGDERSTRPASPRPTSCARPGTALECRLDELSRLHALPGRRLWLLSHGEKETRGVYVACQGPHCHWPRSPHPSPLSSTTFVEPPRRVSEQKGTCRTKVTTI